VNLLDFPPFRRTRRNHAIEHAAIHILTARFPKLGMAGRSDSGGFYLYGDVDTAAVRSATEEAIERLKLEPELAVHPFCGTNFVVGGMLAGLASLAAMSTVSEERRQRGMLELLPRLMIAGTLAGLASQQIGPLVQTHVTTLPDTDGVSITRIERQTPRGHVVHRVDIADAPAASTGQLRLLPS
jgi:hypothetical protein